MSAWQLCVTNQRVSFFWVLFLSFSSALRSSFFLASTQLTAGTQSPHGAFFDDVVVDCAVAQHPFSEKPEHHPREGKPPNLPTRTLLYLLQLGLIHLESVERVHFLTILGNELTLLPVPHPQRNQFITTIVRMSEVDPSKISKVYRSTIFRSYLFGFIGFMVGMKLCDWLMYDPRKHEQEVELMEEEFWRINGEPKHLKPQVVQSVINPNTFRKSWIQVVYGKDSYITKEQAQG